MDPFHPQHLDHDQAHGERGQAAPLLVGAVAVLAAMTAGVALMGTRVTDAARARTAADAAALAGVEHGAAAAAALAAANGATLTSWRRVGDDVIVTVRVGRAAATARATNGP